jgi:hypothetical protein
MGIAQVQKGFRRMAGFDANELRDEVIRPTLEYLGVAVPGAEEVLLAFALLAERFTPPRPGFGPYHLSAGQHRQVWDEYLAFHPDLASEVRGLASQRCFLQFPDRELTTNLAYATAIAWILISTSGYELPPLGDGAAQVTLWQRLMKPGPVDALEARKWLRRHGLQPAPAQFGSPPSARPSKP